MQKMHLLTLRFLGASQNCAYSCDSGPHIIEVLMHVAGIISDHCTAAEDALLRQWETAGARW